MSLIASGSAIGIEPVVLTAIIGAGFVLVALKLIAADIDYARRSHALWVQAQALRERHAERLRSLRPKRR